MCDCEGPDAYREEWRTARKAHHCCECGAEIERGERYNYASGIWDYRPGSFKTCVQCVQVKDWHVAQLVRWDCRPCFTQLFDDYPREELPPHVVVQIERRRLERLAA